jgi:biofilm PGA synthesis N-glycosyltransferase PgaC
MSGEQLVFWGSALLLSYTYLAYPVLVAAWAWLKSVPPPRPAVAPTVSVIVVAQNEAARIEGRLDNLLALDYPRDRLDILVGCDGSTDGTPERARRYEEAGVKVAAFPARRGKPAVLNALVAKASGEIALLADARQRFETGALRAIVAPFADPRVGAVSGELVLTDNAGRTAVGGGIGMYWRYEKFIRSRESRVDSTIGATGAIYAIRRALFTPIPEDTILDDVLVPARIAGRGYRVLFEPRARAHDRAAGSAGEEFARKVRTIAGNFQLFAREPWLLNPWRNRLWLQTVSHKALRLLTPLLLAAALGANLALLDRVLYRWMLVLQVLFYVGALTGGLVRNARRKVPVLTFPYVLCLLSWATVVAFVRFLTGRQRVTWERASSPQGAPDENTALVMVEPGLPSETSTSSG